MSRLLLTGVVLACLMMMAASLPGKPKLRGMWVDVFNEGIKTPEQVRQLIARAKRAGMNALFVQVRSRAQVYHMSALEPRAPDTLPWFDGLDEVIKLARAQDPPLQVHAWLNAHPLWVSSSDPPWKDHIFYRKPEWLTRDPSGNTHTPVGRALDFGHPEAAEYVIRLFMEVVSKYRVDGIHLDFIRYAGSEWGYNATSVQRFWKSLSAKQREEVLARSRSYKAPAKPDGTAGPDLFPGAGSSGRVEGLDGLPAPDDPLWSDWRRAQVSGLVRRLAHTAKSMRPDLIVSAAVVPWGDAPKDFRQSAAYTRCFQDWKTWAEEGWLDLVIPMLYFREKEHGVWFRNWLIFCGSIKRKCSMAAGIGNWLNSHEDTLAQARLADSLLDGVCFFSYASTNPKPGVEAEKFNESFYDRLGELGRARPLGPSEQGAFGRPSTFGMQLSSSLEGSGSLGGFYVGEGTVRQVGMSLESCIGLGLLSVQLNYVVGGHESVRKTSGDVLLQDQVVIGHRGEEFELASLYHSSRLRARFVDCDQSLLPGDLIALRGRIDKGVVFVEKWRWLGRAW